MEMKNTPGRDRKMSKVSNIKNETLGMQQYLYENSNTNISKIIAEARAKNT
jgi:hypothetical protein